MANLPSIGKKITSDETDYRSPVSESTLQKMGSSVNFILDYFVVYPGFILPYAGDEAGLNLSAYLPCDGRAVSRTTYSTLFTAIGTKYGVGDGVSTFNVPDLRGMFIRGVDTTSVGSAGRDPNEAIRTPPPGGSLPGETGSTQSHAIGPHVHFIPVNTGTQNAPFAQMFAGFNTSFSDGNNNTGHPNPASGNTSVETRPINTYMLYVIKT